MLRYFKQFFRKLFPNKSAVDFPNGYITNRFFLEQIDSGPVLVIGDYTGRDYNLIKRKIEETYLLDIVENKIADEGFLIQQSITEPIKFPNSYFKYVIMGEVIEHVWEDKKALKEINRILADSGKLLLSVPFFNDFAEYHYHIYSPKTISILLKHSGFSVVRMEYRGLISSLPNEIPAFLSVLLSIFFKEKSLEIVNDFLYRFYKNISNWRFPNQLFKTYGASITAVKCFKEIDPLKIQKENFKL